MLILKFQPMQLATVIHVKCWLKIRWVFERTSIKVHTTGVMVCFKPYRRATPTTEVSIDAL